MLCKGWRLCSCKNFKLAYNARAAIVLTAACATSSSSGQLCLTNPLPCLIWHRQGICNSLRLPYPKYNLFLCIIVTKWKMRAHNDASTSCVWSPAKQWWGIFSRRGLLGHSPPGCRHPSPLTFREWFKACLFSCGPKMQVAEVFLLSLAGEGV